jgi:hypothetical protein
MEGVWDIEIRGLTRVAQSWRRSTLGLLSDGTVHLDMLMTATSDYRARYYSPIFGRFISEILWSSGAVEEWERKTKRKGNLAEFFAASPLRGSGVKIKRLTGRLRKVDL